MPVPHGLAFSIAEFPRLDLVIGPLDIQREPVYDLSRLGEDFRAYAIARKESDSVSHPPILELH